MKVLITTVPFGVKNEKPLDLLRSNDIEFVINPLNKKLTEGELGEVVDYIHEFENFFDNNDCTVKSDSFKGKLFQTYCYYHKENIKDGLS